MGMTSKERVLRAIRFEKPDRIPISLRFCPEKWVEIKNYLQMNDEEAWEWLGQDVVTIRPRYKKAVSPVRYADPTAFIDDQGYYRDIYGVPFRYIQASGQQYLELAGISVLKGAECPEEIEQYPWPTTEDWDYSKIPDQLMACRDKAAWPRARGTLGIAQFMRGMEGFFYDMVDDPVYARRVLDRIYEFVRSDLEKTLQAGHGQYVFADYNDDLATQRGLMLSPEMFHEFVKPYVVDFCQLAHKYGAYARFHSCGAIALLIDELIECGVDILDPVQPCAAGMDPIQLLEKYRGRLCLHGGLDIQYLLPHGTVEETRRYVRRLMNSAQDGGYILAGSHTIQIDAKVENILAAVDEIMGR